MWTFRRKILLGYGAALLLIMVVLSWAMLLILRLGRASESILRENYQSIQAAEHMIVAVERQDSATQLFLLGYKEQGTSEFWDNETLFLQWLGRAKDNVTIPGERGLLSTLETDYSRYLREISNLQLLHQANPSQAVKVYYDTILPLFRSILAGCIKLRELNHETMYASSKRAYELSVQAVFSILGIGGVSVLLVIGFSLFLSHLISRPVTELKEAAVQLAQGTYDVQVPVRGTDELALLAGQFNLMVKKLQQFREINIDRIIAEKQKSEAVIRSVNDGILVLNDNFLITNLNPEAAKIFGGIPEGYPGKHILEVMKDERLLQFLKETLASGQPPPLKEGEDVLTIATGEVRRHFQVSLVPLRTPSGVIPGLVLVLRDITRLRELDRQKSEFVMTASHELRTPLTTINMAVNLLRDSGSPTFEEREHLLLDACHDDLQRLQALVDDLLELSRIEAGQLDLAPERVRPRVLCDQAVAVIGPQAESKKIDLALGVPESLPEVIADPRRMVRVLVTLLANAVGYTKAGGRVSLQGEQMGEMVHLSVTDGGEGVPPAVQSRIFDKFVHHKPGDKGFGSGLGLTICKEIVRAHHGDIWLASTPDHGSTFTFSLPVAGS